MCYLVHFYLILLFRFQILVLIEILYPVGLLGTTSHGLCIEDLKKLVAFSCDLGFGSGSRFWYFRSVSGG